MRYVIYRSPENVLAVPNVDIREAPQRTVRIPTLGATVLQRQPLREPATFFGQIPLAASADVSDQFVLLGENGVAHQCVTTRTGFSNGVTTVSGIVTQSNVIMDATAAAAIVAQAYARTT